MESIEVVVTLTSGFLSSLVKFADNTGIGSQPILGIIRCASTQHGLALQDEVVIYNTAAKVIAIDGSLILISVIGDLPSTADLENLPAAIVDPNSQSIAITPNQSYFTNVIGIDTGYTLNRRMVVGNSYPEYPLQYPHTGTTVSNHLLVEVNP